jgi:syntaxin 1B/2/3
MKVAQASSETRDRNEAVTKIGNDMIELNSLFKNVDDLVGAQDFKINKLDLALESTTGDVAQAQVDLNGAVHKARAARRKSKILKWSVSLVILALIAGIALLIFYLHNR